MEMSNFICDHQTKSNLLLFGIITSWAIERMEVISKRRSLSIQRNKPKVRQGSKRRLKFRYRTALDESDMAWLRSALRRETPKVPTEVKIELVKACEESETMDIIFSDWKISDYKLSLLLPSHKSNPSLLPWVFFEPLSNPHHHIFGDIVKRHSYCLTSPELSSELLHSKKGWLLFTTTYLDGRNKETLNSTDGKIKTTVIPLWLVNPCTGIRLDLPFLTLEGRCEEYGAFTTISNCKGDESRPDQVIYVSAIHGKLRIFLIRPGDAQWTNYIVESSFPETIFLCGAKLYTFGTSKVTVFELECGTCCQYDLVKNRNLSSIYEYVGYKHFECEGKVMMARSPTAYAHNSMPFYKLEICGDGKMVEWVELTDDELDGRIWFFGILLQSFCVRVAGSGRKVCWFQCKSLLDEQRRVCHQLFGVHCCDMNSGTELRLTRDYLLCGGPSGPFDPPLPYWIDMDCSSDSNIFLDKGITDHDLLPFPDHP